MVSPLCRLFYPENNFKSDLERERQFGATFTHTLYYLAQVNAAMGQSEKGAMYCHTTLLRQLETGQYDPVDWALNCATLSQYYITQGNYMLSRHCLGKCRPILVVFINLTSGGARASQWWEHSRDIWVEFIVGSLLFSERFFCGFSRGAYHLTECFGNSSWKVNGKVKLTPFLDSNHNGCGNSAVNW